MHPTDTPTPPDATVVAAAPGRGEDRAGGGAAGGPDPRGGELSALADIGEAGGDSPLAEVGV